jgi:hypothetical protein
MKHYPVVKVKNFVGVRCDLVVNGEAPARLRVTNEGINTVS